MSQMNLFIGNTKIIWAWGLPFETPFYFEGTI